MDRKIDRGLQEVAQALGSMYADVPPPPGGLAAGRTRLLEAAARQRAHRAIRAGHKRSAMALRFAGALAALLLATAALGSGIAWAASDSMPGEFLYPVKLSVEDLQLSLVATHEAQIGLALSFADERVTEMQSLVDNEEAVPAYAVERLDQHIQYALQRTAEAPPEETEELLARIVARTQTQSRTLERVRAEAGAGFQTRLELAWRVCWQGQQAAVAGLADPQAFRSRYQGRHEQPEDVAPPSPSNLPATDRADTPNPVAIETLPGPQWVPEEDQTAVPSSTVEAEDTQSAPAGQGATTGGQPAPTSTSTSAQAPAPGGGQGSSGGNSSGGGGTSGGQPTGAPGGGHGGK